MKINHRRHTPKRKMKLPRAPLPAKGEEAFLEVKHKKVKHRKKWEYMFEDDETYLEPPFTYEPSIGDE